MYEERESGAAVMNRPATRKARRPDHREAGLYEQLSLGESPLSSRPRRSTRLTDTGPALSASGLNPESTQDPNAFAGTGFGIQDSGPTTARATDEAAQTPCPLGYDCAAEGCPRAARSRRS